MSSENASNDMAQKTVKFDFDGTLLLISGVRADVFSIDCAAPKLNLKQLYDAVFADIKNPVLITVEASANVKSDPEAKACFDSLKKIVDTASKEVNEKLPEVIAKREMLEKSLAESVNRAGSVANAT